MYSRWNRYRRSGPHIIHTQVESMEEALHVISRQQLAKKIREQPKRSPSLRRIFAISKASATLNAYRKKTPKKVKPPNPFRYETEEELIAMCRKLYATGYWSTKDLTIKFKLPQGQAIKWVADLIGGACAKKY